MPEELTDAQIQEAIDALSLPETRQLLARLTMPDYWEWPVDIKTFLTHKDYLNRTDWWPTVLEDLVNIFAENGNDDAFGAFKYNEAALLEAIGSGKSYKIAGAACYLTYRQLCFTNRHKRFFMADSTRSAFMVVAPTAKLAKEIIFGYVSLFIGASPWFQKYYKPDPTIKSMLRFDPAPEDEEGNPLPTIDENGKARYFKNLAILPGNSSETSALGWSLYGAAIDEANFWETYESIKAGKNEITDEMYTKLQRRIRSRFKDWGVMCVISSSEQEDDFIERKLDEAEDDDRIYARRRATWEAKPPGFFRPGTFEVKTKLKGKDIILQVPNDLRLDFDKNLIKSLRDHASVPAGSENNYLDPTKVELASTRKGHILPNPVAKCDSMGYIQEFAEHMKHPVPYPVTIGTDLSLTRDSCGMAMSYWDPARNCMTTPFLWEIKCTPTRPLDYDEVKKVWYTLRDFGWNFHMATFDNFQSTDIMQQFEAKGIATEKVSVDVNTIPYDTLSGYLLFNELVWYPHPTAVKELKKLVLIHGKKVDHPKAGTKDTADALAQNAFMIGRDIRAMTSLGEDPGDKFSSSDTGTGAGYLG